MGLDSSSKGGKVSGEITSPRLVNTVRYQGRLTRSPMSMPTFVGREVSSSGGNFSGAIRSCNSPSKRFHRGLFQLLGSKRSISASSSGAGATLDSGEGFVESENTRLRPGNFEPPDQDIVA